MGGNRIDLVLGPKEKQPPEDSEKVRGAIVGLESIRVILHQKAAFSTERCENLSGGLEKKRDGLRERGIIRRWDWNTASGARLILQ